MLVKKQLIKGSLSSLVNRFSVQNRVPFNLTWSKARIWILGLLLGIFGFSTLSWRFYRSAKQESKDEWISDRSRQSSTYEPEETRELAGLEIKATLASDTLAQWLAMQASLIVKTEPELALKLMKEAYRITNQCPPVEVKQALAVLFAESLDRMPVLYYEFDIQANPRKLIYSEAHQAFIMYMEDGRALEWSPAMQLPKPYPVPANAQISANGASDTGQNEQKVILSSNKQLKLVFSKQAQASTLIKNQKDEIHGFFPLEEQISHASFGEDDHQILTISEQGKCKLWALDEFGLREEDPYASVQISGRSGYPPFIRTERGIELLNHKGETWRKLDLEIPPDQIEVAMIGERIISFKMWRSELYYWDLEGRLLRLVRLEDRISGGSISSDGIFAIALTYEEPTSGRVYDLRTGEIYPTLDTLLTEGLFIAAFSPGMPYMITHVDYGLTLGIWDTKGNKVNEFSPNGLVEKIYFSPDGTYFHTQSNDKKGQVWDMEGNLLGTTDKNIKLLSFTPDESRINYLMPNEDSDIMITKKRSLPTLSFIYQYLMEQLDLAPLTADEKTRFGL